MIVNISKSLLREVRRSWRKHILGKNPIGRPRRRKARRRVKR